MVSEERSVPGLVGTSTICWARIARLLCWPWGPCLASSPASGWPPAPGHPASLALPALFFLRHLTRQETHDVPRGRDDVFGHIGRGVQRTANVGVDITPGVEVQVQRNPLAVVDFHVVRGSSE